MIVLIAGLGSNYFGKYLTFALTFYSKIGILQRTMLSIENAIISPDKIKRYLLVPKKRNDKSRWLAQAGYKLEIWHILKQDLKEQLSGIKAVATDMTPYGQLFEVKGEIIGPNGHLLRVCTIWMEERETNRTKFITMYPDHKKRTI